MNIKKGDVKKNCKWAINKNYKKIVHDVRKERKKPKPNQTLAPLGKKPKQWRKRFC